jgi:hypothetical protein
MKLQLKLKPNPLLDSLRQIRPPIRIKKFLENPSSLCLLFPMQLKQMTDEETREYHLKNLYELSLKSLGEIPQLEQPNEEEEQWIKRRMSRSSWPKVRENKIGDWKHWSRK